MINKKGQAAIVVAVLSILAGIIIYGSLGYFLNYSGMTIFESFPIDEFTILNEKDFSVSINNNAALNLPFVPADYCILIEIDSVNDTMLCTHGSGKGTILCGYKQHCIDTDELNFKIAKKPDAEFSNFNVNLTSYLWIFPKTKSVECLYLGERTYKCGEIDGS